MRIEFKKLKFGAEFMHQETLNFQVEVYVDGKHIATALNEGHGGCTNIRPLYGVATYQDIQAVDNYLKTLPEAKLELAGMTIHHTLDFLADVYADEQYNKKQDEKFQKKLEKLTANHIIIVDKDQLASGRIKSYSRLKLSMPIAHYMPLSGSRQALKDCIRSIKLKHNEVIYNKNLQELI